MKGQFHKVVIPVRPTPAHPRYYDIQFGALVIWLFADSIQDASDRAIIITDQLPYERAGERTKVFLLGDLPDKPKLEVFASQARDVGLAVLFCGCPPGVDEDRFEDVIIDAE